MARAKTHILARACAPRLQVSLILSVRDDLPRPSRASVLVCRHGPSKLSAALHWDYQILAGAIGPDDLRAHVQNRMRGVVRVEEEEGSRPHKKVASEEEGAPVGLYHSGMCGTAAVVVKVNSIRHGDTVYDFDDFAAWFTLLGCIACF